MGRLAKLAAGLSVAVFATVAGAAHALTVTIDFSGTTSSNPGLPGGGAFSGSIQYSTNNATHTGFSGSGQFQNVFTSINMQVNGVGIVATPTDASPNSLTQVALNGGTQDAWLSNYSGAFDPTGVSGIDVARVSLEIRSAASMEVFNGVDDLFSALSAGDTYDLTDLSYISLSVGYIGGTGTDGTILRKNTFSAFDIAVTGTTPPTVPLPAGLPLLLTALGGLAVVRRRRTS